MIKEQCISCGRDDVPLFPTEGAFMPEGHKSCARCQMKYSSMAGEADRIMTELVVPEQFYCYKCHESVVFNDKGEVPMYCNSCMNQIFSVYKGLRK